MKIRPSGEQQTTDGAKTRGLSAITSAFQSGGQLGGFGAAVAGFGAAAAGFGPAAAGFGAALAGLGGAVAGIGGAPAAQAQHASKAAQRRILAEMAGFNKNFVA